MTVHDELDDFTPELDEVYIPAHDSEALLLSAMMWSGETRTLVSIADQLSPDDFYRPQYRYIFSIMQERLSSDESCDPASMNAALSAAGAFEKWSRSDMMSLLAMLATLKSNAHIVAQYAAQVASVSYRRQYRRMVSGLFQAAENAPEEHLFAIMVEHGRAQRRAWERYQRLRFG